MTGKLENLGDVALLRRRLGDIGAVEQDPSLGRLEQPRDQVEQGRLAAARGPEQRIGAAIRPFERELLQRPILVALRDRAHSRA